LHSLVAPELELAQCRFGLPSLHRICSLQGCEFGCDYAAVLQGRLQLDHVLQLLVVFYSLSGDRMPPAPPLYSADEAQLKAALADAIMTAAAGASASQQQWPVQLECLPAAQYVLHQVGCHRGHSWQRKVTM
jgi:hypothetical protein